MIYASQSLGSGKDDARLSKVFEALTLLAESLSSISLKLQAARDKKDEVIPAAESCAAEIKSVERGIIRLLIGMSTRFKTGQTLLTT